LASLRLKSTCVNSYAINVLTEDKQWILHKSHKVAVHPLFGTSFVWHIQLLMSVVFVIVCCCCLLLVCVLIVSCCCCCWFCMLLLCFDIVYCYRLLYLSVDIILIFVRFAYRPLLRIIYYWMKGRGWSLWPKI